MRIKIIKENFSAVKQAKLTEEIAFKLGEIYNTCNKISAYECITECILHEKCPFNYLTTKKLEEFLNTHEKI